MQTLGIFLFCIGLSVCLLAPLIDALTRIERGIFYMADAQTQALADLSAAVSNAITTATAKISALVSANANLQPDDSAAIEAQVKVLNDFAASLNQAAPTA
jgi:hypothetical protein